MIQSQARDLSFRINKFVSKFSVCPTPLEEIRAVSITGVLFHTLENEDRNDVKDLLCKIKSVEILSCL
jgi:hypothetical protein